MNRQPIIGVTPLVDAAKESYWMLPGYFNGILQAGGSRGQEIETILANTVKPRLY